MDPHYRGLFAAYISVVVLTLLIKWLTGREDRERSIWPAQEAVEVGRPWLDVGLCLLAAVATIGLGQVYLSGVRLGGDGLLGGVLEAINQILIFSPFLALLLIRKQSLSTALLPSGDLARRIPAGLTLAVVAVFVYDAMSDSGVREIWHGVGDEARDGRLLSHVVQVFLEDLVIAMLLVRLAAAVRSEWAAGVLVALLFSAGHIPAMMASEDPVTAADFLNRGLDFGIGLIVMVGLIKTRDLLWLYPTHLLMDLTQFAESGAIPA